FRLKKPFPLLPFALGKTATPMCPMMPERLANTDPFKHVAELIGSGPYRWVANERVAGSRAVYERFAGYRPRDSGVPGWTAGPKVTHFDRVEWIVIPDDATAAAALQSDEADWWEIPNSDLMPVLKQAGHIRVEVTDPTGVIGFMRMNCLQPPFDNPAIRRAMLGAVDQRDYMIAIAGTDHKMWRDGVGVFCPGTSFATDIGMEVLNSPRDYGQVQKQIQAAGYANQKTVLMVATDTTYRRAMGQVGADMLRKSGLNVDEQDTDWGTLVHRRDNPGPVDKGGWSALFTTLSGLDLSNPSGHAFEANGRKAWFGWPTSPKLEALRAAWYDAPDLAAQKRICADIQRQWWIDVPQVPVGQWLQPTAWRDDIGDIVSGFPVFWGVRRGA
ncbi:MAG TPA: ABC transporter substrate-binding protein, partial [Acetobacteraceae bacterium]|nr:ABC transporter substrate-binding protein [Acetobacteraceae bacterium]